MGRARVDGVACAVVLSLFGSAGVAWARGGGGGGGRGAAAPAAPLPPPSEALIRSALETLAVESPWDRERVVPAGADQRQKTWVAANFAVVVPNVTGGGGVQLAVSDPGAPGKGPKSSKREGDPDPARWWGIMHGWTSVGIVTTGADLSFHGATLPRGVWGVGASAPGPDSPWITVEIVFVGGGGAHRAEFDVPRAALAAALAPAPDDLTRVRLGQAVLLNLAAARLLLAHRIEAAVRALVEEKPTPVEATNLNSSRSNIYRVVGLVDHPVTITTVKGTKSNSDNRAAAAGSGGIRGSARYRQIETERRADKASPLLARVARGEEPEAVVGSLVLDRRYSLRQHGILLGRGTYTLVLLDASHHKPPGRTEPIVEIRGPDDAVVVGVAVNGDALARQLMTPPPLEQFRRRLPSAIVLSVVASLLDEKP